MSSKGRKIDEFSIEGHKAVLRWDALRMDFTLEVNGKKFEGENARMLKEEAAIFLGGYDKLVWKPVIVIDPDVEDDFSIHYERLFEAKHGRELVHRRWRIDGKDEDSFGRWRSDSSTGEILQGTPGNVDRGPKLCEKAVPYTPERWTALRNLDNMLKAARESAKTRLEAILKDGDLDEFLASVGKRGPNAILFNPKA